MLSPNEPPGSTVTVFCQGSQMNSATTPTPTAPQGVQANAAPQDSAIDFDSDAPLQCPLRQPGDDGAVCEACQ